MRETSQSNHDYLISMGWESIEHPDGFKIYSHWRFPSKYKEGKAVEKMEESLDRQIKSAKVFKTDKEGLGELRNYLLSVLNPKQFNNERTLNKINQSLGLNMNMKEFQKVVDDSNPF